MSVREVRIATCDRCGKEIELGVCDYPTPKDWLHVQGCGDLCEHCAYQIKTFMMDFFDGQVPEKWQLPREC